jgi:hypothetical protein
MNSMVVLSRQQAGTGRCLSRPCLGHGAQLQEAEQGPCVAQAQAGPHLQSSPQPHVMAADSQWQEGAQ